MNNISGSTRSMFITQSLSMGRIVGTLEIVIAPIAIVHHATATAVWHAAGSSRALGTQTTRLAGESPSPFLPNQAAPFANARQRTPDFIARERATRPRNEFRVQAFELVSVWKPINRQPRLLV